MVAIPIIVQVVESFVGKSEPKTPEEMAKTFCDPE